MEFYTWLYVIDIWESLVAWTRTIASLVGFGVCGIGRISDNCKNQMLSILSPSIKGPEGGWNAWGHDSMVEPGTLMIDKKEVELWLMAGKSPESGSWLLDLRGF